MSRIGPRIASAAPKSLVSSSFFHSGGIGRHSGIFIPQLYPQPASAGFLISEAHMIYLRTWFIGHSPGQYTHMQLWNKGTEPIRVDAVVLSASKDSSACLLYSSAALPHGIVAAGAGANEGLRSDGSLSTHGELRFVVDPEYEGGQLLTVKIKADESKSVPELVDWEIPPGRGLMVRMGCTDVGLYGSFKWHESA